MKKEDQIIINAFKNGSQQEVNKTIDLVYKHYFDTIKILVENSKGSITDAEDVFQETIIIFYRNIQNDIFKGNSAVKTYLYSIARNIWFNKIKRSKTVKKFDIDRLPEEQHPIDLEDLNEPPEELKQLALNLLNGMKEGCKKILIDFYYKKMSIEEIQSKYGFASNQVVRTKKYRCLKKLTDAFNNKRKS